MHLINQEARPLPFAFEHASCYNEARSAVVVVEPLSGTLPPNSTQAIALSFEPREQRRDRLLLTDIEPPPLEGVRLVAAPLALSGPTQVVGVTLVWERVPQAAPPEMRRTVGGDTLAETVTWSVPLKGLFG